MTGPTETPSLTTEQARDIATRWAFWHAGLKQCADNAEFDREMAKAPMLLATPEREQLFAWVRARMAGDGWLGVREPGEARCDFAGALALDLGLEHECPDEDTPAWALCEAAGWPS